MPDNKMIENLNRVSQRGKQHAPEHQESPFAPAEKAEQLFGLYSEYLDYKKAKWPYKQRLLEASGGKVDRQLSEEEKNERRGKRKEERIKIEEEIASDDLDSFFLDRKST